jgi:hypothetical protein
VGGLPYVKMPKDLSKVKTKIALNLTKRQLVCFGIAAITAGSTFYFSRGLIGNSAAGMTMIIVALPSFLAAMYEKNGQPFERVLWNALRVFVLRKKKRPYKTQNYYDLLVRQADLDKEVFQIINQISIEQKTNCNNSIDIRKEGGDVVKSE